MKRENMKLNSKKNRRIIVVLIVLIVVAIAVVVYSGYRNKTESIINKAIKCVTINDKKISVNFKKLKKMNKDVVAYIKFEDMDIEFPVVKTDNNEFYANHNLYKRKSKDGWLFVDYKCKVDGYDKNLVIYGNSENKDGIFGNIVKKVNSKMYKDNIYITLATEKENIRYQLFSAYQIKDDVYYNKTDFNSVNYTNFLNIVNKRSVKDFKIELKKEDNVLTIASQKNSETGYITVLHAKKI